MFGQPEIERDSGSGRTSKGTPVTVTQSWLATNATLPRTCLHVITASSVTTRVSSSADISSLQEVDGSGGDTNCAARRRNLQITGRMDGDPLRRQLDPA